MAEKKHRRKWRNFLIAPQRQFGLSLRFLLASVFFLALMLLVMLYAFTEQFHFYLDTLSNVDDAPGLMEAMRIGAMRSMGAMVGLAVLFVIVFNGVVIVYTHRIYGAVFALTRFVDQTLAGSNPAMPVLRRNDHLQELADRIFKLAQKVRN